MLREFPGGSVDITFTNEVFSLVQNTGSVAGSNGCNRFFGSYEVSGEGELEFSPFAQTLIGCQGLANTLENLFNTNIANVDSFDLEGGDLRLKDGDVVLFVFNEGEWYTSWLCGQASNWDVIVRSQSMHAGMYLFILFIVSFNFISFPQVL